MIAEILGPDMLIVLAVVVLLFGGSRIPKLARSLGSAKKEFERGLHGGEAHAGPPTSRMPAPQLPANPIPPHPEASNN